MLTKNEIATVRNLEIRCQRVLDALGEIPEKLGAASDHLEQIASELGEGKISVSAFAGAAMKWMDALNILAERTSLAAIEFSKSACDVDFEELDEDESGEYKKRRTELLDCSRDLIARASVYQNAVNDFCAGWKEVVDSIPAEKWSS